jgi:hypothetical protein
LSSQALVRLGGAVAGGLGNDSFWTDTTDVILDASAWEINNRHVHAVSQFMSYTIDGGSPIAVSKELNGQNLADPLHIVPDLEEREIPPVFTLKNYQDNPLFASIGPSKDDIDQGGVGDCYFVATLSAIADANPDFIRQMVVDLGDGTYAVRFYDSGQEVYVRVDADLWLQDGNLAYAGLGLEGSIWAPIVEKAYAFFRKGQGTYQSISSGNGTLDEHLNVGQTKWEINDGITPEQVIEWYNAGSPAGVLRDQIRASVIELLTWIQQQFDGGKGVTTGARSNVSNMSAIQLDDPSTEDTNESTYRRGQHVYMVDSVLYDGNGTPYGLRLRNPYGSYLNITDLAHLHFCIGRAVAWDLSPIIDATLNPNMVFTPVFVSPIGPVTQTNLARSAATMQAARSLALQTYQSRSLASDAMIRSLVKTTSSSQLSPFETEWEF